ncbi:sugar ABC transporter ATP-binding protein [Comamonas kerstersii]|uniref:sugar ABC transporter ATP-binding protein n=1 Tax=Comamonas kerstersii TaxID=225992 RepID=UPI00266CE8D4|nr:sugar ABC transporter ATP-binding protein [Comamonas kerstersii]MDO4968899.1 sugar ABC transporter ATP-binding protein [Comamonadaceae bacterium]
MAYPTPADHGQVVMRLEGIGKDYGDSTVLDGVSLDLRAGEVLALTGENGAGKSTCSKIMCGLVQASRGQMTLMGKPFAPVSRTDAERQGVRMVLQELGLVNTLTVAENLLLDRLPHRFGLVDRKRLHEMAREQLAKMGLDHIDPRTKVSELGIGMQQMVEIARNLRDGNRVLVLDEPTAMLTAKEIEHLFAQIDLMKAQGVALVYVSHRLEELQRVAERVAVLRDGRLVDVLPMQGLSEATLVERMVGRHVETLDEKPRRKAGPVLLRAENMCRGDVVKNVSLELHAGEVLGVAGLVGAGRTELLRLLYGADKADGGSIELTGQHPDQQAQTVAPNWRSPMQAVRAGIALITEDRKAQGLLLPQSIRVNTSLSHMRSVSAGGWLNRSREAQLAKQMVQRLRVRSFNAEQSVGTLSGGNQQKVIFARWLHRDCPVVLLDEPTRGVDVGARSDLYAEINTMTHQGKAVMVVSSDLRELMELCDRIAVMHQGRLVATFERGQWSQQALLAAAFGDVTEETAAATAA